MDDTLSRQVVNLVNENRDLKAQVESDARMITMLKQQVSELHERVVGESVELNAKINELMKERDRHVSAYTEIENILTRASETLVQALRARIGDDTPEELRARVPEPMNDLRMPALKFSPRT